MHDGTERCDICFTHYWFRWRAVQRAKKRPLPTKEEVEEEAGIIQDADFDPSRTEWRQCFKKSQTGCFITLPLIVLLIMYALIIAVVVCATKTHSAWLIFLYIVPLPVFIIFCYLYTLYRIVKVHGCWTGLHFCQKFEPLGSEYENMDMSTTDNNLYPFTKFADVLYNHYYPEKVNNEIKVLN